MRANDMAILTYVCLRSFDEFCVLMCMLTKGSGDGQDAPYPPGAGPHHNTPSTFNALSLICAIGFVVL